MWFIGGEVEQETSAPLLKEIPEPPLYIFWALENEVKTSLHLSCSRKNLTEGILSSSVVWMYVTIKQKHVIETVGKQMCLELVL